MKSQARKVPLRSDLWSTDTSNQQLVPRLIGTACQKCSEIAFPIKENGICTCCQSPDTEDVYLSREGIIHSFTVVMMRPPGFYRGDVPYAVGYVELPEGLRIETLFADCELDDLYIGMPVELVIETLHTEENGDDILTYKFRPA